MRWACWIAMLLATSQSASAAPNSPSAADSPAVLHATEIYGELDYWLSVATYEARLSAGHPWVPHVPDLIRNPDGTCRPGRVFGVGAESATTEWQVPLAKLFARSAQVVFGRVVSVDVGVMPYPAQVATRVRVAADEVLRDDDGHLDRGSVVDTLLAGGHFDLGGQALCSAETPGVELPSAGDEVLVFGESWRGRPDLIHAEESIFRVVDGEIRVPAKSPKAKASMTLEAFRKVAEAWPPRDLPDRIRITLDLEDDVYEWMSAKEYYAWLPFAKGLPRLEALPSRTAAGCPESDGDRYQKLPDVRKASVPRPLADVVARAPLVLVGRVAALHPGVGLNPTWIRTLVEIDPEEVLRDAQRALAKTAKVYLLLEGGEFQLEGTTACAATEPGYPIPPFGTAIFYAGAADPLRPGLLQGASGFLTVENGRVRVPEDRLSVRGEADLADLRASARSAELP